MNLFTIQNTLPIIMVCGLIFFLLFLRPKQNIVLKILERMVLGFVLIILGNLAAASLGVNVHIGVNPITLLTCTILGFPGVCGLFVIPFL